MLEAIFLNLIDRIVKAQNSHRESSDESVMRSRNWEFIFSDFDGWVVLYCLTRGQLGGYWIYPMLYPQDDIDALKEQLPSFDIHVTSVAYDHVVSGGRHWIEPSYGNYMRILKGRRYHSFFVGNIMGTLKEERITLNFTS